MSKDEQMVHIQVTTHTREAIGLLKAKYKLRRMTDVIDKIIQEVDPEVFKRAERVATLKAQLADELANIKDEISDEEE